MKLILSLGLLLFAGLAFPSAVQAQTDAKKLWVYVGTYTQGASKGIYRFTLDLETGKLSDRALAGAVTNPSFVAIHPNQKFLYAVSEVSTLGGKKTGGVSAFAIDPKTGDLTLLNQQSSGGAGPCHLNVDKAGKNVLAANYGGGSACVLPIGADGRLSAASAIVQHKGSSVNKSRQEGPHAHSANLDAANRFAFIADLGLDKVLVYRFDPARGTITANDPPAYDTAPGAGPRHFAFHPDGKSAFVINELNSTLDNLDYDADKGILKKRQSLSTLPKGFKGNTSTAEVVVHPSGRFVYGSNRGHNSIAIYRFDDNSRTLTFVGHQNHKIKTPRNFTVDPTGRFLLVANQDAASIIVFRVNGDTGELSPVGEPVEVPFPVCIRMMPARE